MCPSIRDVGWATHVCIHFAMAPAHNQNQSCCSRLSMRSTKSIWSGIVVAHAQGLVPHVRVQIDLVVVRNRIHQT